MTEPAPMLPATYCCSRCGASGVRLWRPYQSFTVDLLCRSCAESAEKRTSRPGSDQIGWRVPAILILDALPESNFWGYTSAPANDYTAWESLPTAAAPATDPDPAV